MNLRLSFRLMVIPLLALVALVILFAEYFNVARDYEGRFKDISETYLKAVLASYELDGILKEVQKGFIEASSQNDVERLQELEGRAKEFNLLLTGTRERVKEADLQQRLDEIGQTFRSYFSAAREVSNILINEEMDDFDRFTELSGQMNTSLEQLEQQIVALKHSNEQKVKDQVDGAAQVNTRTQVLMGVTLVVAAVLLLLVTFWTIQSVTRPLSQMVEFTEQVAEGDLSGSLDIRRTDEIGLLAAAFNNMVINLRSITRQIQTNAQEISVRINEIASAAKRQTESAGEQAAAVNETSATVNELKETSRQSESRAKEVVDTAERSVEVSREGTDRIQSTVNGMEAIRGQVEEIANNILALSEQTQQIGDIIASVNDIAEQSNLLAVNASIEAAKAGEFGRGFEVVAREMKNLADQSRNATQQVRMLLMDIQKATTSAVMATESGTKKVNEGIDLVFESGQSIDKLAEVINESAQAAKQIAVTAHQQSVGIEQIAIAIENINQATQASLADTEQTDRSAGDLGELAVAMAQAVARYRLDGIETIDEMPDIEDEEEAAE